MSIDVEQSFTIDEEHLRSVTSNFALRTISARDKGAHVLIFIIRDGHEGEEIRVQNSGCM